MTPRVDAAATFDARFLEQPAFSVFEQGVRARLRACLDFPAPGELLALAHEISSSLPPWFDFVREDAKQVRAAGGFDRFVAQTSRIPTRPASYHDLLGALVWLHFPALKTAIHRVQLSGRTVPRTPEENAATHFDESGMIVVSSDPAVFGGLADLRWREVLWDSRAELLLTTRFLAFGHGLLDALRAPHLGLTGKALFARVRPASLALPAGDLRALLDRELGARLAQFLGEPARLAPLPVLGVPGWSPQQSAAFYDDPRYFRRARQRARAPARPAWLELD